MNAQLASDRIITDRLRSLADSLPAVLEAEPEAVHKARVASRRVREALPVVLAQAPARRAARLRRSFRRVTRALGAVRELDVTRALLDEVLRDDPEAAPALERLVRELGDERSTRREQMLSRLDAIDFESLVGRIERLMDERADESDEARALPAAIEGTLGVRVARRVRALEVAVDRAGGLYAVEALHAVRIATKKLRYVGELASDMRIVRSRRPLTALRAAQETLGAMHDEQVLAERLRRLALEQDAGGSVARVLDRLDRTCRERHARYLAMRPRVLAAAAQLVEAVTGARRSHPEPVEPAATVH
jgi:CHAD domain-containing protein